MFVFYENKSSLEHQQKALNENHRKSLFGNILRSEVNKRSRFFYLYTKITGIFFLSHDVHSSCALYEINRR